MFQRLTSIRIGAPVRISFRCIGLESEYRASRVFQPNLADSDNTTPRVLQQDMAGSDNNIGMRRPFAEQLIMNTLSKAQALIQPEDIGSNYNVNFDSYLERVTLKDESFVRYLRTCDDNLSFYEERKLKLTSDSHKKLDLLLRQPFSFKKFPQTCLKYYLRVRHNVNRDQISGILNRLIQHRWYRNASVIMRENCRTLDELLELSLEPMMLIKELGDEHLGIAEFLIAYENQAVLPQLLKLYENKMQLLGTPIDVGNLTRTVNLGKLMKEKITKEYLHQFDSLSELEDELRYVIGYDNLPALIKLQVVLTKMHYIKEKSNLIHPIRPLRRLLDQIIADKELISTPGVMSRIALSIEDLRPVLTARLVEFKLHASDLHYLMVLKLSHDQTKLCYDYHESTGLRDMGVVNEAIKKFISFGNTDKLFDIIRNYRKELNCYYLAKILLYCRSDLRLLRRFLLEIDRAQYKYVLQKIGVVICNEFSKSTETEILEYPDVEGKKENYRAEQQTVITFDELFSLVDALKPIHVNHEFYLGPIFDDVLMNDMFIEANRHEFEKSLIRFASRSRVNLPLLNKWNHKMFHRFNKTGENFLLSIIFNRKLLVQAMRSHDTELRNKLLDDYGENLTILKPEILSKLLISVLNDIDNETGRNVITLGYAVTMLRRILYSYVNYMVSNKISMKVAYDESMEFLNGLNLEKRHGISYRELVGNAKTSLVQSVTELDPSFGYMLTKDATDNCLIKGYLLGLLSTNRFTSDEKLVKFKSFVHDKIYCKGKNFIGERVLIEFCDVIVTKIKTEGMNSLTEPRTLLWALKQCQRSQIDVKFYQRWYYALEKMKTEGVGYWDQRDDRVH